ncbi:MAG TPA: sigma-70 family RNA polymerase sigma factor [Vicinamibacterales bacterium]
MAEHSSLAHQFEQSRGHLRAIAFRMLGSSTEADDAVQESWLRLSRSDVTGVDNLTGWLTTVVARVCLDMLRSRKARREEPLDLQSPDALLEDEGDAEHDLVMADSLGLALLLVLETLTPAERVAFVLHDMFDVSFDEIAHIVNRSPVAARQLASRARRRVQGASSTDSGDRTRQREVVEAFLAASRDGDFNALLALLDPEVVMRADRLAVEASAARQAAGAPRLAPEIRGREQVAETFSGRAGAAQLALINGVTGAVWAPGGRTRAAFTFTVENGKISEMEIVYDPERIAGLEIAILR